MLPESSLARAAGITRVGRAAIIGIAIAGAALGLPVVGTSLAAAGSRPSVEPVSSQPLPHVPGKAITIVRVKFPPGASSPAHHHAGSVSVLVLSGAVRSQLKGGEVKVYKAGETFFEPPGSVHAVAENASATEPAEILAVFVADEGATLTAFDQ